MAKEPEKVKTFLSGLVGKLQKLRGRGNRLILTVQKGRGIVVFEFVKIGLVVGVCMIFSNASLKSQNR